MKQQMVSVNSVFMDIAPSIKYIFPLQLILLKRKKLHFLLDFNSLMQLARTLVYLHIFITIDSNLSRVLKT